MTRRHLHLHFDSRIASRGSRGRGAFTLVELLVVIGVIGVLASLLLPSLAGARRSAWAARCGSNLRQFGLAAELYWDDHDGAAFRYRGAYTNDGDIYWFGWLERGAEGTRRFEPGPGALWPYLASRGVEVCPSFRTWGTDFKPKAVGGTGGYGYSLALSAPSDQPPVRLAAVNRPESLAVFADAAQVNDFQAPASPEHPMLEEFYYLSATEPTVHFRHDGRALVVFADGHTATERALAGSIDARLPAAQAGRLRAALFQIAP